MCMCVQKNIPRVVATDFFLKINSPNADRNSVTQRSPFLLLVSVFFLQTFSPHSKAKANYKSTNLRKIGK